jgi:hypothetical protein
MKKILSITAIVLITNQAIAQTAEVQKVHSIKLALPGLSYGYERPVSPRTVINYEFMLAGTIGYSSSGFYSYNGASNNPYLDLFDHKEHWLWSISPILIIEPRYYYNYMKRQRKEKRVINNAANYLAISAIFQPGITIAKKNDPETDSLFAIIPKWGMRRALGKHFIFELTTGAGIAIGLGANAGEKSIVLGLTDLKIGYSF